MIFILILFILTFCGIFTSFMEIGFLKKMQQKKAEILNENDYFTSIKNAIWNEKFHIFSNFYAFLINATFLVFGFKLLKNWLITENTALNGTFFILSYLLISTILTLPLSYYNTMIKDKKQGFSNSSLGLFIKDSLKSVILLIVFGFLLIYLILLCFSWLGNYWYIGAFGVSFAFILGANIIYPNFIILWFNKLKPLENGELKLEIDKLLNEVGFKCNGVFIMDASKRDSRLNAFFAGLGKVKKVVLFDTLVEKMPKNELLAVLGHELGHFKHKDVLKNIIFSGILFFILFFVFSFATDELLKNIYLDGFDGGKIMFLLLFSSVIVSPISLILSFISRKNEFNADAFGVKLSDKKTMQNALIILAKENKATIDAHFLKELTHSHPSIVKRLKAIENQ